MHQNTFGGGAPPGPVGRAYAPPDAIPRDPLAALGGLLLRTGREGQKGREGAYLKGEGKEKELTSKGREGRGEGLLLRGTEGRREATERKGRGIPAKSR